MRAFEFKQGKSRKFWNIELDDKQFTVTFGKIGAKGQKQTKKFATPAKAQVEHDKLIAQKLAKGYVETKSASPLQTSLEQAILDNPADLAAHSAYADFLCEQGDPRGEFIQLQLALENPALPAADRKKLQKREQDLLKSHMREWLGSLAPFILDKKGLTSYYQDTEIPFRFARGWLDALQIPYLTVDFARALAREPRTSLLRKLTILYVGRADDEEHVFERGKDIPKDAHYYIGIYPLLQSPYLNNIRFFQLGEDQGDDYRKFASSEMGVTVADLVARMPRIEELHLFVRRVDLDKLFTLKNLDRLRVLQVYHMNEPHPLEKLAKNPVLRNLTHLHFHPHFHQDHGLEEEIEAYISLRGVRAIIRSPHLKGLLHVRLRCSDMGNAGCQEIVDSGILKRLRVLDLRHGCIKDKGAEILAACPDLKNLYLLDVDRNALTRTGIAALKKVLGKRLHAENQQTDEELAKQMYLAEGDFE